MVSQELWVKILYYNDTTVVSPRMYKKLACKKLRTETFETLSHISETEQPDFKMPVSYTWRLTVCCKPENFNVLL